MKITLFAFFLLFFVQKNISQSIVVDYIENKIITPEKLLLIPEFAKENALKKHAYTLEYFGGLSIYKNSIATKNIESSKRIDSDDNSQPSVVYGNATTYRITDNSIEKLFFKDLNKNLIYFDFYANSKDNNIKDKFIEWNWQITNETKLISGFNCRKATSNNYGYFFTAWFTEDIAINAGPEKFDGLPGLILCVSTAYYEFTAVNVKISKDFIQIKEPTIPSNTITYDQYVNFAKTELVKFKAKGNTTTTNGSTTITTIRSF